LIRVSALTLGFRNGDPAKTGIKLCLGRLKVLGSSEGGNIVGSFMKNDETCVTGLMATIELTLQRLPE